jgi:hypothetical protein
MEELDPVSNLSNVELFQLFKQQLKKDFEGAGIDAAFTDNLSSDFLELKNSLLKQLDSIIRNNTLAGLLYRVDINEFQIKKYTTSNSHLDFDEVIAELIIKRILQKIILKKRFSA